MMKLDKRRQKSIVFVLLMLTGCSPVKKNEYVNNKIPAAIKTPEASTSKEPMLCYKNKGNIGGHIVVEIKGSPSNINAYKQQFKLLDSEVSTTPEKVKLLKEKGNKIKQEREAKTRKIMERDKQIRLGRKRKINAILVRDCFIRKARKKRNKLPDTFNPKKDLLIEISLVNAKAKYGYISLFFDPKIKKGQKHIYVVDIPGTSYAKIRPLRGRLGVFTVNRRNNRTLTSKLMKRRGRVFIPRKKHINLVVTSVSASSKYSGRITGWIRTK